MQNRNILISGAGIAGPALAYWLAHYGFSPTLVERAAGLREGGYMIDFWGIGYDVADRMGLAPRLRDLDYRVTQVVFVDRNGRRVSGLDAGLLRRTLKNRFVSVQRGDLARAVYQTVEGRVETIFGDTVESIAEAGDALAVTFEKSPPRHFDLVIGADGLHSAVRRIAFGPEKAVLKYLGYWIACFVADGYPHRDEHAYVGRAAPGRQVSRYALRGDRSAFFFMFDEHDDVAPAELEERKARIVRRFSGDGWEVPEILTRLDDTDALYFDTLSQVCMEHWSKGRVAVVGDAAYCPSLLAGEGSGLAMAGAYILAGELARADGDHRIAFKAYEGRLQAFIRAKQASARKFARSFAPRTRSGLVLRDAVLRLMAIPLVARWMVRRTIADDLTLPDYGAR